MCVGMMMSHCVALNVELVCELRDCVCVGMTMSHCVAQGC